MKTYCLKLKPLAPWATPWHADTVFAALCWQLLRVEGEEPLQHLLEAFRHGAPPFLVSDVFPEKWFPRPLFAQTVALPHQNGKAKPPTWISEDQFRSLLRGEGSILPSTRTEEPLFLSRRIHSSIHRVSGTTTGEGGLFEVEEWSLNPRVDPAPKALSVFIRTVDRIDHLVPLFRSLSCSGFGKERSAGLGAFEILADAEPCAWMDSLDGSNAFVSISHFVPATTDPTDGTWGLRIKYPKFSPEAPVANTFKGRLVMLRPGSAFRVSGTLRPFYGTVLKGLRPEFPESIQYAMAFAIPARWPEET